MGQPSLDILEQGKVRERKIFTKAEGGELICIPILVKAMRFL
jgi:hypothetical protein